MDPDARKAEFEGCHLEPGYDLWWPQPFATRAGEHKRSADYVPPDQAPTDSVAQRFGQHAGVVADCFRLEAAAAHLGQGSLHVSGAEALELERAEARGRTCSLLA